MAEQWIRIGRISSINVAAGLVRVTYPDLDNSVTAEIPLFNANGEYKMPKVGSNCLVVHLSNGQSAGICLGGYWSDADVPPETGANVFRKDMIGGYLADRGGAVELHGGTLTFSDQSGSITLGEIIRHIRG